MSTITDPHLQCHGVQVHEHSFASPRCHRTARRTILQELGQRLFKIENERRQAFVYNSNRCKTFFQQFFLSLVIQANKIFLSAEGEEPSECVADGVHNVTQFYSKGKTDPCETGSAGFQEFTVRCDEADKIEFRQECSGVLKNSGGSVLRL